MMSSGEALQGRSSSAAAQAADGVGAQHLDSSDYIDIAQRVCTLYADQLHSDAADLKRALRKILHTLELVCADRRNRKSHIETLQQLLKTYAASLDCAFDDDGNTFWHYLIQKNDVSLLETILQWVAAQDHEPTSLPSLSTYFTLANDEGYSALHELMRLPKPSSDTQRQDLFRCLSLVHRYAPEAIKIATQLKYLARSVDESSEYTDVKAEHRSLVGSVQNFEALIFLRCQYPQEHWQQEVSNKDIPIRLMALLDLGKLGDREGLRPDLRDWMAVLLSTRQIDGSFLKSKSRFWLDGTSLGFRSMMSALMPEFIFGINQKHTRPQALSFTERGESIGHRSAYALNALFYDSSSLMGSAESYARENSALFDSIESLWPLIQPESNRLFSEPPSDLKHNLFANLLAYTIKLLSNECLTPSALLKRFNHQHNTQVNDRVAHAALLFNIFRLFQSPDHSMDAFSLLCRQEKFYRATGRKRPSGFQKQFMDKIFAYGRDNKIAAIKDGVALQLHADYKQFLCALMVRPETLESVTGKLFLNSAGSPHRSAIWAAIHMILDARVGFHAYRVMMGSKILRTIEASATQDVRAIEHCWQVERTLAMAPAEQTGRAEYSGRARAQKLIPVIKHRDHLDMKDLTRPHSDPFRVYINVQHAKAEVLSTNRQDLLNYAVDRVLSEHQILGLHPEPTSLGHKRQTRQQRFMQVLATISQRGRENEISDQGLKQLSDLIQTKSNWPEAEQALQTCFHERLFDVDKANLLKYVTNSDERELKFYGGLQETGKEARFFELLTYLKESEYQTVNELNLMPLMSLTVGKNHRRWLTSLRLIFDMAIERSTRLNIPVSAFIQGKQSDRNFYANVRLMLQLVIRYGTSEQIHTVIGKFPICSNGKWSMRHGLIRMMRAPALVEIVSSPRKAFRLRIYSRHINALNIRRPYQPWDELTFEERMAALARDGQQTTKHDRLPIEARDNKAAQQAVARIFCFYQVHDLLTEKYIMHRHQQRGDFEEKSKHWISVLQMINRCVLDDDGEVASHLSRILPACAEAAKQQFIGGASRHSRYVEAIQQIAKVATTDPKSFVWLFKNYTAMLRTTSKGSTQTTMWVSNNLRMCDELRPQYFQSNPDAQMDTLIMASQDNPFIAAFTAITKLQAARFQQSAVEQFKDILNWFYDITQKASATGAEIGDGVDYQQRLEAGIRAAGKEKSTVRVVRKAVGLFSATSSALAALYGRMQSDPQQAHADYMVAMSMFKEQGSAHSDSLYAQLLSVKGMQSVSGQESDGEQDVIVGEHDGGEYGGRLSEFSDGVL